MNSSHPLKLVSLACWAGLLTCQLYLFWPPLNVTTLLACAASLALMLPLNGLIKQRRYTFKWIGFMALVYFCIGISELVSNPSLRLYGFGTTVFSTLLFLASIYYARFLGIAERQAIAPKAKD